MTTWLRCGCAWEGGDEDERRGFGRCSAHRAAPDLLAALEGLHNATLKHLLGDIGRGELMGAVDDAEVAMAQARGTP